MPQVTVYIREDDLDAWKNVQKKSQFMHDALTTGLTIIPPRDVMIPTNQGKEKVVHKVKMAYDPEKKEILDKPIGNLLETVPNLKVASELRPDYGVCKKCGTPLTKFKKCLNTKLHK